MFLQFVSQINFITIAELSSCAYAACPARITKLLKLLHPET